MLSSKELNIGQARRSYFHTEPKQESQAGDPAILLGGFFASTDPVLASDGQMAPPGMGMKDEMRFILTAESGLKDRPAGPFVNLTIVAAREAKRKLSGCSSGGRLM
ncbi:hypothetical protein [Microvirga pakistanensis]|uniref:hypothetical protein n=1 Tax=Microvirga pakistanensis TaxID=1682650 RepID=UPI001069D60B|nr:hypothetical protein [Microvirga pakistanensis]